MAQTLSTLVQNTINDPRVANNAKANNAISKVMRDTVVVPDTADSDTIIMGPLPVDAVLTLVDLTSADLGSAGTVDVGLYQPSYSGSTTSFIPIDADCIATGLNLATPNANALAPQRFNGLSADAVDKKLWEIAGLTTKPSYPLMYIGLKTTAGTTASGTVTIVCSYTI